MRLRILLIVLLAANVLFFVWAQWVSPASPVLPQAAPALPQLQIDAAATAAAGKPRSCVAIGPFRDTMQADLAVESFRGEGYEPRQRSAIAEIRDGYWVYIGTRDVAAQRRTLNEVRRAGIDDAYAMPAPDEGNRVSLGVFSGTERAERRARTVRRLGYEPVVEEHARSTTVYWVDMEREDDAGPLPLDALMEGAAAGTRLEVRRCAAEEPRAGATLAAQPG